MLTFQEVLGTNPSVDTQGSLGIRKINPAHYLKQTEKHVDGIHEDVFVYTGPGARREYPVTIRRGVYSNPNANAGRGSTNFSVKLSTWVVSENADLTEVVRPYTWVIAANTEGTDIMPDVPICTESLENLLSVLLPDGTGSNFGVGNTTHATLDALMFGVLKESFGV